MKVVVIGHGGHSKVVTDIIKLTKGLDITGYLDDKYEKTQIINNIIHGPISAVSDMKELDENIRFVVAIGDNLMRKTVVEMLNLPNSQFVTVIHPTASISSSAKIGNGTVIMPQVVVNADTMIGNHSIINSGSVVEHDCLLEDYVHLCPKSVITGNVTLCEGAFVGSGATIIPNKRIGDWVTIGAGATVINHIPPNCLAVGTPAKEKLKIK
ncbi:acetyltransferase [Bacillus sp. PS06]|uniref:acetyltransferase n=1 Tax=Bacillus sp. PS06 TaxID=2764176 RepID=UPI0017865D5B|nr:acetyltransferase [Bacillus sp. PS06]MBD8071312.1 acetyltransferase [Bacillus sp. PS06]